MAVSNTMTVTITGDATKLKSALSDAKVSVNDFGKTAETSGGKIKNVFSGVAKVGAAAVAAAGAAVAGIVKSAVSSFADYEQLVGGVETLFKGSADTVQQYAADAYKTAGLSANEYMEQATSFSARLLQGLGGDTEAAAKYADVAITDMADNANKMGTNISHIQDAYQGFAKQNYTMLDNLKLGYGGTQSEMARLINDSGVLGDSMTVTAETVNDVSFDKMIEAIHVVQENMGITGTTAEEAASTISGSLSSMKSAWGNLLTGVADDNADFGKLMENMVSTAKTAFGNLLPRIQQALGGVAQLIAELAPVIITALPALFEEVFPPLLEAATSLIIGLIEALPALIDTIVVAVVSLIPTIISQLQSIIPTLTNSLISAVISIAHALTDPASLSAILGGAITLLMEIVNAIPTIATAVYGALPGIITNIVTFLTDPNNIGMIIKSAIELFFGLVKAVPQILGALLGAFGALVGNLWNGIKGMFGSFAGNFGDFITGIFRNAINGMIRFIENFINSPIKLINGFIDVINGAFGVVGVHIGNIGLVNLPRLQHGGIIGGTSYTGDHQLARVNSGEMVINRSQQAALWDAISGGNYGDSNSSTVININVDASGQTDPDGIAIAIAKAMNKAFISQGLQPNLANAGSLR